jgi:hypothetical protein
LPDQRFCLQCCSSTSGKTTTWANTSGENGLGKAIEQILFHSQVPILCTQVRAKFITSAWNNASQGPKPSPVIQTTGTMPFEDPGVDFTEVKPCQGYQYFLVLVCT